MKSKCCNAEVVAFQVNPTKWECSVCHRECEVEDRQTDNAEHIPECPFCHSAAHMIKHTDGQWVCHGTHRSDPNPFTGQPTGKHLARLENEAREREQASESQNIPTPRTDNIRKEFCAGDYGPSTILEKMGLMERELILLQQQHEAAKKDKERMNYLCSMPGLMHFSGQEIHQEDLREVIDTAMHL